MGDKYERKHTRRQHNKAARQHQPYGSRAAIKEEVHELRQALKSVTKTNQQLVSLNTNLRKKAEDFQLMKIHWTQEKGKLMDKNRSLESVLGRKYFHARNEVNRLERLLKAAETKEKRENEKLHAAFKNSLNEFQSLRTWWTLKEEKITTELKEAQEKCRGQGQQITKKSKRITKYKSELLALEKYHLKRERWWEKKCKALKARLREERAEREEREAARCKEEENATLFPGKEEDQQ